MRSTNKHFRSKSRSLARRAWPMTRLQVERLEERLAPDAGGPFQDPPLPVTVEPNELRQLLMFGDGFQPGDDLSGVPEFYVPDLAAILSPVSGSLPGSFSLFGPFGPAGSGIDDPGALGSFTVTTEDYDFGNVFDPPFIAGTATVELTARVHAPTDLTGGARPILFFLHGNHASTFSGTSAAFEWPPAGGRQPLPNYQGYDYLGQVLASHGYIVVSVSTNGVNVLGSPTPGTGMQARAELMQRHLDIWRDFNETGVVTGVPGTPSPFGDRFVGKVDLQSVGTMGHSRGGEGVVAHFQHNQSLGEPYDIDAVFSLAPVDFQTRTITNVPHAILLPYHDGDVSDLQGARFFDRERYALAGDTAPKHVIEVLGANHNFYNTNWTPGLFPAGASDDGAATGIAIAEPPTPGSRLNAARTRGTSIAYITAFFRTYVGNDTVPAQTQFFRYLTGDLAPPPSALVAADRVFLTYQPPDLARARLDVNRLTSAANLTTNTLGGSVTPSGLSNYAFGATFQGLQALQLGWNSAGASWQNDLGPGGQDISRYFALQFRAAVPVNALNPTATQDFSIVLTDGAGNTARTRVSDVYEQRSTPLFVPPLNGISRKAVLNGVRIPLASFAGVDLTDVRSIRFEFDQRPTGFLWLSDLMFANVSLGFAVTSTSPAAGEVVAETPPTTFVVNLSDAYDPNSVEPEDLTVNDIAANSVTFTNPTTLTFHYDTSPVTAEGLQTLALAAGAIRRQIDDELLDGFTTRFRFDALPMEVASTVPAAGSIIGLPFTTLEVVLNEAPNPDTIGINDLTLSMGTVTAVEVVNPTTFRYTLSGLNSEGTLTVRAAAGAWTDEFGNPSREFTGTYALDFGITPFPLAVAPVQPLGSLIYEATIPGFASGTADIDIYTIDLDAGQTLTVLFDVPPTSLLPALFVLDPSGVQVGSSSGGAGGDLVLQTIPVTTSGVYSVVVVGIDTGSEVVIPYALRLTLNAALEAERFGGPANDTPDTAQDISDSFLVLGDGDAIRGAVLGAAASAADQDWYTFNIDVGERATLALTALGAGTVSLLLTDANGATLATGTGGATNVSQAIRDFVAPATGNYFVRVTGSAGVNYSLVATRNTAFDLEPNDSLAAAQPLPASGVALGHIGAAATGTTPTTFPVNRTDGTGFLWDIQGNGSITDGTSDAYDGGLVHAGFPSQAAGTLEDGGREVVIGPATIGGARVTRKVFVPADQGYARFLEIITNPGTTTLTYTVTINTNLGSDGSEVIVGTSSGGTVFTIADDWIITDDADGSGDPTLLHVIAGSGGRIRPSAASRPSGLLNYSYQLTLGPGETQIVMHFASQNANRAAALARAPALTALGQGALAGLTPEEAAAIVNFDVTPGDFYHVTASAGDMITLLTRTPADGLGQFANILDAVIELYDPDGNLVASDDNGGDDGRNAFLTFQAVADGVYTVRVLAAGATSGEYVLDLDL